MLIVTAGSHHKGYDRTIKFCEKKCEEYGYKFKVYDLGGLGYGIPVDDPRMAAKHFTTRCAIKPELIRDTLKETDEEFVVWIDGDATLIGRIDEVEADTSFDVGVTVRPERLRKKTHYINAGVIFFRNNQRAKTFVDDWIAAFPPWPPLDAKTKELIRGYSDQNALEEGLLLPNIPEPFWDKFQSVHEVHGARVKLLECLNYNNFWSHWGVDKMKYNPEMKIIHFKGKHWAATKNIHLEGESMDVFAAYCKKFLDG